MAMGTSLAAAQGPVASLDRLTPGFTAPQVRFPPSAFDEVEAAVDFAISQGWSRVAFAETASVATAGPSRTSQALQDSVARQALNLTLTNHDLHEWTATEAQVIVSSPITAAGLQLAADVATTGGDYVGAGAAVILLSPACPGGSGANDMAAAAESLRVAGLPPSGDADRVLPLPPPGVFCLRPLTPAYEAANGGNISTAAALWAADMRANNASQWNLVTQDVEPTEWNGLVVGPFATTCTEQCTQVLRHSSVWKYTYDEAAIPASGVGVRQYVGQGRSERAACGAPRTELASGLKSLVVGQSASLNGPASALGISMRQGVLRALQGKSKVRGRRVILLTMDDGYNVARAVANTKRLVERENVFMMLGSMGSATGAAVMDYLNERGIPQVGQLSGADVFRSPPRKFTVNVRASYADEAAAMVQAATDFGFDRVSLLAQNDTFGFAGRTGLSIALGQRGLTIHTQGYYESADMETSVEEAMAAINATLPFPQAIAVFATSAPTAKFLKLVQEQMPGTEVMLVSASSPESVHATLAATYDKATADSIMDGIFVTQSVPPPDLAPGKSTPNSIDFTEQEGYYAGQLAIFGLDAIAVDDPADWTRLGLIQAINERSIFRIEASPEGEDGPRVLGPYSVNCTQGMRSVFNTRLNPKNGAAGTAPFITTITGIFSMSTCGVLDAGAGKAREPFLIGQSIVLSGGSKFWGEQMQKGVEAAFDDANRGGGVGGRFLRLVTLDDGYNPVQAAQNAVTLVNDYRVLALLSTFGTGTATAMLKELEPMGVPLIAPLSGAREFRHPFRHGVINLRASYDDEAYLLVKTAVDAGRTRCSIFYQDDGYGKAGLEGITVALWNNGLAIHSNSTYLRNRDNVTSGVAAMATHSAPEAVFLFAVAAPAAEFVCAASLIPGWENVWYLAPSPVGDGFLDLLGDCADRATVFVSQVWPDPANATVMVSAAFQASLDRKCGGKGKCEYTYEAMEGYMGGRIMIAALERAGETVDTYTATEDATFDPARAAARAALLNAIYEAGLFAFEQMRLGPYGSECGNTEVVGVQSLGCGCNQGMHSVLLSKVESGTPRLDMSGQVVTPRYFVRQPQSDVFFDSCGITTEYMRQEERPIVFGQSAAFSGDTASLGTGMQHGIRAAFSAANSQGGVNGKEIRLVSFDDAYNPERAVRNTREVLDAHKVFGIIGTTGTAPANAIFDMLTADGVPWVGPLTGAGFLRSPFVGNVINARASYGDECAAMVKHMVSVGVKRVVHFGQSDSFGDAGADGIRAALRYHKLSLISDARYPKGTLAVYQGLVDILSLPEPPEAVVMFGTSAPLGRFCAMLRVAFHNLGLQQPALYVTSFVGPRQFRDQFIASMAIESSIPVPDYLSGVYISSVVPIPNDVSSPLVRAYQEDLRSGFSEGSSITNGEISFEFESLEGWIVGRLATMALQRSSALTRDAFVQAFYTTSMFQVTADSEPLGPFVDGSCNQGLRRIWLVTMNDSPAFPTGRSGDFSLVKEYDFAADGCGVAEEYSRPECPDGSERVSLDNSTIKFTCRVCIRGFYSSNGAPCRECPPGTVSAEGGMANCTACGPGKYQDRRGQSACLNCDIYSFSSGAANTECIPCGPHALAFSESSPSRNRCQCNTEYYGAPSMVPDPAEEKRYATTGEVKPPSAGQPTALGYPSIQADGLCRVCPFGARCCGFNDATEQDIAIAQLGAASGLNVSAARPSDVDVNTMLRLCETGTSVPLPLPGHIESRVKPATMISCSPAEACLGVPVEYVANMSERCAEGYAGLHCAECKDTHYRFYGQCLPCGEDSSAWFRASGMFFFVAGICLFALELSARKSTFTGLGLMLNSLQIAGLFNDFFASWPAIAAPFYAGAAVVTFKLDAFSPECKLSDFYPRDLYERQILWLILPLVFALCYAAIFGLIVCARALRTITGCRISGTFKAFFGLARLVTMDLPMLRASFISGFGRLAISGYPVLVSHALAPMRCITLEDGTSVMEQDYSLECYDERWWNFLWTGVVGLTVYGVGIPVGLAFLITGARASAAAQVAEYAHHKRASHIENVVIQKLGSPMARQPDGAGTVEEIEEFDAELEEGGRVPSSAFTEGNGRTAHVSGPSQQKGRPGDVQAEDSKTAAQSDLLARGESPQTTSASMDAGAESKAAAGPTKEPRLVSESLRVSTTPGAGSTSASGAAPDAVASSRVRQESVGSAVQPGSPLPSILGPSSAGQKQGRGPSNKDSSMGDLVDSKVQEEGEHEESSGSSSESDGHEGRPGVLGAMARAASRLGRRRRKTAPEPDVLPLSEWKPKSRGFFYRMTHRMGRIPSHAMLASTLKEGGEDDGHEHITTHISKRMEMGHDVVTHDDLENWHKQDLLRAHAITSVILVDADHILWPFVIDYVEDAYYWSVIEMLEFLAVVLASVFVQDPVSQLSLALLAISGFMVAVMLMKPYRTPFFNRVEMFNDACQVTSLVVAISHARTPRPISEYASGVALALLIAVNMVVLFSSILRDLQEKVSEWRNRSFWGSFNQRAATKEETAKRAAQQRRNERRRKRRLQQQAREAAGEGDDDASSRRSSKLSGPRFIVGGSVTPAAAMSPGRGGIMIAVPPSRGSVGSRGSVSRRSSKRGSKQALEVINSGTPKASEQARALGGPATPVAAAAASDALKRLEGVTASASKAISAAMASTRTAGSRSERGEARGAPPRPVRPEGESSRGAADGAGSDEKPRSQPKQSRKPPRSSSKSKDAASASRRPGSESDGPVAATAAATPKRSSRKAGRSSSKTKSGKSSARSADADAQAADKDGVAAPKTVKEVPEPATAADPAAGAE
ncbi:hypothetical protein FNF29_01869 [Cafeteria roenbergensis]|uniref:Leucine-binding protein domain-containing protein n=1 Tax=Cafeteria roenbergensis TaxID=33653 RepID=A0A5A8CR18_CAFRO|nr:hypothetical protein FNF29_01869 [Cafeteria roenbergensis]|eukprot:KAA0155496.1 hypothetical protein FNF29_01869 [Cafeteria roenbergensis]